MRNRAVKALLHRSVHPERPGMSLDPSRFRFLMVKYGMCLYPEFAKDRAAHYGNSVSGSGVSASGPDVFYFFKCFSAEHPIQQ
ncbi:MAG: hypothetical protein JWP08_3029 [Bryobacterales bacterium]|nr:hypothetical protein [Bryobacterales bacterium]